MVAILAVPERHLLSQVLYVVLYNEGRTGPHSYVGLDWQAGGVHQAARVAGVEVDRGILALSADAEPDSANICTYNIASLFLA